MQFSPPLKKAQLIRRYKRFLADVETADGEQFTIHCPNTGAMTACAEPGCDVWYSTSDNPKRKYPHTWELSVVGDHWICVNTQRANGLFQEAVEGNWLSSLLPSCQLQSEKKWHDSRIDFYCSQNDHFIEVKSVTLLDFQLQGQGYFPDAVTLRGQKHLQDLMDIVHAGKQASLCFIVPHSGIQKVSAAVHIDATYAGLLQQARQQGVNVMAFGCSLSPNAIEVDRRLPVIFD